MVRMRRLFLLLPLCLLALQAADAPDLKKNPTLYVVGYAHLDTEWNWDYITTIGQYLPHTMLDNFALFEKYPHYIFNFTGANRYRMMKEYYPHDYAKVKQYVDSGRWYPCRIVDGGRRRQRAQRRSHPPRDSLRQQMVSA